MIGFLKWVLQSPNLAARIFLGKYLSFQPGDFASPNFGFARSVSQ